MQDLRCSSNSQVTLRFLSGIFKSTLRLCKSYFGSIFDDFGPNIEHGYAQKV